MAVTKMTIAVDRKKKKDEVKAEADFINCVAFGKTAEIMAQYLSKGRLIGVNGSIHTGSYKNKEDKTVYTTDVYVTEFQFLEKGNGNRNTEGGNSGSADGFDGATLDTDDTIPF